VQFTSLHDDEMQALAAGLITAAVKQSGLGAGPGHPEPRQERTRLTRPLTINHAP
jgi:hypothetical protein